MNVEVSMKNKEFHQKVETFKKYYFGVFDIFISLLDYWSLEYHSQENFTITYLLLSYQES